MGERGRETPTREPRRAVEGGAAGDGDRVERAARAALPFLATALLALIFSRVALPGRLRDVPTALLVVIAVQLGGTALAWLTGATPAMRRWLVCLLATAVVVPTTALQAAAAREPFVSLGRGSAAALLWLTLGLLLVLAALFVLVSGQCAAAPERASVAFLPIAAVVPATMGARGDLGEQAVLATLAVAMAVAAAAAAWAEFAPSPWLPLVGAAALGGEFVLLWALRYVPRFGPEHGRIVALTAVLVLALVAAATVFVPVGALFARRLAAAVDAASHEGPTLPPTPASRSLRPAPRTGAPRSGSRPPRRR